MIFMFRFILKKSPLRCMHKWRIQSKLNPTNDLRIKMLGANET